MNLIIDFYNKKKNIFYQLPPNNDTFINHDQVEPIINPDLYIDNNKLSNINKILDKQQFYIEPELYDLFIDLLYTIDEITNIIVVKINKVA